MKKLIIITIALLITNTVTMANDVEKKLENKIDKNIEHLEKSLEKFRAIKAAIPCNDVDRDATLRKVCSRLQRQTKTLSETISYMDFQLEIAQVRKSGKELERTRDNIHDLKDQIKELQKKMQPQTVNTIAVAAR